MPEGIPGKSRNEKFDPKTINADAAIKLEAFELSLKRQGVDPDTVPSFQEARRARYRISSLTGRHATTKDPEKASRQEQEIRENFEKLKEQIFLNPTAQPEGSTSASAPSAPETAPEVPKQDRADAQLTQSQEPTPDFDPTEARAKANEAYASLETGSELDSKDAVQARLARSRVLSAAAGHGSERDAGKRSRLEAGAREDLAKLEQRASGESVAWNVSTATDVETDETRKARVEKLRQIIAERYPLASPVSESRNVDAPRSVSAEATAIEGDGKAMPEAEDDSAPSEKELILADVAPPNAPAGVMPSGEDPLEKSKREFEESRTALRAAEAQRAEQEREYVSGRGALRRGVDALFGRNKARFKESEANMNAAAAAHAQKLEAYIGSALAAKTGEKWGAQDRRNRILARFASRDLVTKGELSIAAAREEAKTGKESGAVTRALGWCAERNAWFDRKFKNKYVARTLRTLTYSAAGAGLATAFGAVALPGTFGYFSWRFAKSVGIGFGVGDTAGVAYNEFLGKRAARNLKREQDRLRTGMGSMDATQIQNLREKYRKGNTEAIARKRRNVEAAAAFIAGAGWNLEQFLVDPSVPDAGSRGVAGSVAGNPPAGTVPSMPPAEGIPPQPQIAPPEPPMEVQPTISIDVQANPGRGWEDMADRAVATAKAQHLTFPPGSDMDKLLALAANPDKQEYLNALHRMAMQTPSRPDGPNWFHDGTSEIVRPDMHMTIGADGQLHVGEAGRIPNAVPASPGTETAPLQAPGEPQPSVPMAEPEASPVRPSVPSHPTPQPENGIEIKAPAAGAFAPAAVAAAYMATGEKPREGSRVDSGGTAPETVAPTESIPTLTTDAEGRNLIDGGSEEARESLARKYAAEQPEKAFMFRKKIRTGGFLGLFSKEQDAWFMAYAERGKEPQIFETVNNRDWRAVNFSKPGGSAVSGGAPAA